MILGQELPGVRQRVQPGLDDRILRQHNNSAAAAAAEMVMMRRECAGQLQLVLPTDLQALHDAELLKQRHRTVEGGAVDAVGTAGYQLAHGLRFLPLERFEYYTAR